MGMRKRAGMAISLCIAACIALSTAVYAAGTTLVGDQTIYSAVDSNAAGHAEAFRSTASASGTVTSLTVYVPSSSKATSLAAGLYADNGGTPGALLGQGQLIVSR